MPEIQGSSPALLPAWSAQLTTRNGLKLNVRSSSPEDEQELIEFFRKTSPEDLRFRFLSSVRAVDVPMAHELVDVDHARTENLLAFDARDGRLAATAMIAANEHMDEAEVAVIVRSDLKGHGIGWATLAGACDYARERQFKSLHSMELSDNQAGISLEHEMGFVARPCPDDMALTILTKNLEEA